MKNLQTQNKYLSIGIAFLSGFTLVIAFFIYLYNFPLPEIPREYFIYNTLLEEVLKFIVVIVLVLWLKLDPLYIAFIGAGFGFGEELSHFYFPNGTASLYPLWMHIIGGLIMSYFFYKASGNSLKWRYLHYTLALIGPVIHHGLYNSWGIYWISFILGYGS